VNSAAGRGDRSTTPARHRWQDGHTGAAEIRLKAQIYIGRRNRPRRSSKRPKGSGQQQPGRLNRLPDRCRHAPHLHRSQFRWFIAQCRDQIVTRRCRGLSHCYRRISAKPVSVITKSSRSERNTATLIQTQLSRTHIFMSYRPTVFEDLRKPKGIKR
jgi:hypothetical protein